MLLESFQGVELRFATPDLASELFHHLVQTVLLPVHDQILVRSHDLATDVALVTFPAVTPDLVLEEVLLRAVEQTTLFTLFLGRSRLGRVRVDLVQPEPFRASEDPLALRALGRFHVLAMHELFVRLQRALVEEGLAAEVARRTAVLVALHVLLHQELEAAVVARLDGTLVPRAR